LPIKPTINTVGHRFYEKASMFLTQNPYIRFRSNPYTDPLIENWQLIRDQYFLACEVEGQRDSQGWLTNNRGNKVNGVTRNFGEVLYSGKIKTVSLMLRNCITDARERAAMNMHDKEEMRWYPMRCNTMPWLFEYTKANLDNISGVTFNTALPGTKLNHHWGLDENYIRIHLCLEHAGGCVFNIEGWEHQWETGELFGFDDAHVLHGTKHTGTVPRSILIVDLHKNAIRSYSESWPCRGYRPDKESWNTILEACNSVKQV